MREPTVAQFTMTHEVENKQQRSSVNDGGLRDERLQGAAVEGTGSRCLSLMPTSTKSLFRSGMDEARPQRRPPCPWPACLNLDLETDLALLVAFGDGFAVLFLFLPVLPVLLKSL